MDDENRQYYVYEHIRLDNMTCFYVGQGHGNRCETKRRNAHHDRVADLYGYETKIIKDGLTQEEALLFERETIEHYVFDLGYGIDISGFRKDGTDKYLTNQTFGGGGVFGLKHTKEWCEQHSKDMTGENNPSYGINVFATLPPEKQQQIRQNHSQLFSGENNPMYGVSPKMRMDEETYKRWLEEMKSRDYCGKNNPNYQNDTLHNKVKDDPELRIKYYSRKGSTNGRARQVNVYNNGDIIKTFTYIGECAEWLKDKLSLSSKISTIRSNIITSIKKDKLYHGYKFGYVNNED